MNDVFEILAVGFSIALVFSLPFAFVAFMRYLRYKERIALAEQGVVPREAVQTAGVSRMLRWGIIFAAVGLALSCSVVMGLMMLVVAGGRSGAFLLIVPVMFLVLLPLFFGVSLIVINRLNHQAAESAVEPVPPGKMG